jgi:hypothetical protein
MAEARPMLPSATDRPLTPDQPPDPPVRFRLRDARVPPAHELVAALWGDQVLEGQVVGQSRAEGDDVCVVVRLSGLDQLVVVSLEKLLSDG